MLEPCAGPQQMFCLPLHRSSHYKLCGHVHSNTVQVHGRIDGYLRGYDPHDLCLLNLFRSRQLISLTASRIRIHTLHTTAYRQILFMIIAFVRRTLTLSSCTGSFGRKVPKFELYGACRGKAGANGPFPKQARDRKPLFRSCRCSCRARRFRSTASQVTSLKTCKNSRQGICEAEDRVRSRQTVGRVGISAQARPGLDTRTIGCKGLGCTTTLSSHNSFQASEAGQNGQGPVSVSFGPSFIS